MLRLKLNDLGIYILIYYLNIYILWDQLNDVYFVYYLSRASSIYELLPKLQLIYIFLEVVVNYFYFLFILTL